MNPQSDLLDILEVVRTTLSAIAVLAEGSLNRTGSVESQKAVALAARARTQLDAVAARALGVSRAVGE
jgi:hypothetical protein